MISSDYDSQTSQCGVSLVSMGLDFTGFNTIFRPKSTAAVLGGRKKLESRASKSQFMFLISQCCC